MFTCKLLRPVLEHFLYKQFFNKTIFVTKYLMLNLEIKNKTKPSLKQLFKVKLKHTLVATASVIK